jgi:phosphoenolpyruvate synthase/pyruvate phosphate dikinase
MATFYSFSCKKEDIKKQIKNILGKKAANLAKTTEKVKLHVPPKFTV